MAKSKVEQVAGEGTPAKPVWEQEPRRHYSELMRSKFGELHTIAQRIIKSGPKENCKFVFFVGPKLVGKSTVADELARAIGGYKIPFNAWAYRSQAEWLATLPVVHKDKETLLVPFTGREHMIGFMDAVIDAFGEGYLYWQYATDLNDVWNGRSPDLIVNDSVRREWEFQFIEDLADIGYDVTVVNVYRDGVEASSAHETEVDYRDRVYNRHVKVVNLHNDSSVELAAMKIAELLKGK